ncbi:hypothetical protein TNCV_4494821 [Trichonephila clavipes]|nr:hypothetical protein TNCV_4494821 [Trichonephila clavipes]
MLVNGSFWMGSMLTSYSFKGSMSRQSLKITRVENLVHVNFVSSQSPPVVVWRGSVNSGVVSSSLDKTIHHKLRDKKKPNPKQNNVTSDINVLPTSKDLLIGAYPYVPQQTEQKYPVKTIPKKKNKKPFSKGTSYSAACSSQSNILQKGSHTKRV